MTAAAFDPFDEAQRDDPYPGYAALRREHPVAHLGKGGGYAVARYDDVARVLRHPELFSSIAMQTATSGALFEPSADLAADEATRIAAALRALPFDPAEMVAAPMLIASDPPRHGPRRRLVNRGFTPRRVAELEPRVRTIARELLAKLDGRREIDLVADFFVPLPVTVIAELLGIEPERSADFKRWSDCAVAGATGGAGAVGPADVVEAIAELSQYLEGMIERRRREPREDLITTLVSSEAGDAPLTPAELVMFVLLLLVAGNETTTNLLGNTWLALQAHPEELARVRGDPRRIPALVEEVLRYDSPIQFLFRQATRDVELAGTAIPAGSLVLPLLGSANRDDARFPEADRFDPSRDTRGHLAFGLGIHFCLGASLARLEARVALEELRPRLAHLEPAEERVHYLDSYIVRGPKRLRVRVRERDGAGAGPRPGG